MSLEAAAGGSATHVMSVDLPRGRVRPQHAGSLDERSTLSARDSCDLTSVRPAHMNWRPSSCRPLLWAATTAQMRVLRGQTLLTRTYAAVMPLLDMRWPRCTAHTSMRRDRWRLFMRATRALLGRLQQFLPLVRTCASRLPLTCARSLAGDPLFWREAAAFCGEREIRQTVSRLPPNNGDSIPTFRMGPAASQLRCQWSAFLCDIGN